MSPSPSRSNPRPKRKPWAPKWLVLTHRYLGVVFGGLMLIWFASGIGMLFVHWPEVSAKERAAGLPQISWAGCCAADLADGEPSLPAGATIEDLAGHAVLRAPNGVTDLTTGRPIKAISAAQAEAIAAAYARRVGVIAPPQSVTSIERDQWTVTGYFNKRRPFWKVRFADSAATDIYVSIPTGEVAQHTDRPQRILNWLGPIPHWLYPQVLRQDTGLWTQVVIWTSTAGIFLTLTGLYLGLIAWRPWRDDRLSPFRGVMRWHHFSGLAAGVLTLSWVASGLLSMQPWGLLDSPPDDGVKVFSPPAEGYVLSEVLDALRARAPSVQQVQVVPFEGRLHLAANGRRFDAELQPAPLTAADLTRASRRLGPIAEQGLMTAEDAYWYGHHETVQLPVWRAIRADGSRYYIDPTTGRMLRGVDAAGKTFRWLHLGLHRLDLAPGFNRGGGWAAVMTVLLLFCTLGVGTGVWLGCRRLSRDLTDLAATTRVLRRRGLRRTQ